jgi:hypothetical protein
VRDRLPRRPDPPALEAVRDLRSRERSLSLEHLLDEAAYAFGVEGGHALLSQTPARAGEVRLDQYGNEPAEVAGAHQVERSAHRPGQDDRAILQPRPRDGPLGESLGPGPEREAGRRENLRLNAHEVFDDTRRPHPSGPVKQLSGRAEPADPQVRERSDARHSGRV